MLIRENYQLFILATGLFENIASLENQNNMTFLIRAPKFSLCPLNLMAISNSYKATLNLEDDEAIKCAKLTKGYALAFQLLGFLMFGQGKKKIDKEILNKFDQYLDEFAYSKIWSSLTKVEQNILSSIKTNNAVPVAHILKDLNMTKEYFSQYRDRLIKKGLLDSSKRGYLTLALPRFSNFIQNKLMFLE